ncbi:MAG: BNR-4 repeat-containing protein [Candidatus Hydrogenedentota bacterium]
MKLTRRTFLHTSLAASAAAVLLPHTAAANAGHTLLSAEGCGRATGYAEANKIVTRDGKTHVAWLDSIDDGFRVRVRTLNRATGTWSPAYTVGKAHDNHGGPALSMDAEGYLHICYYPHHHPMRYRRSRKPNDASAWTEAEEFGARTTYPTLVCGKDNTLYCTCRESGDGPWRSNLYTKKPGGTWQGPHTIMVSQHRGYSHFMDALAWGPDHETLHLSTRIYSDEPARGHTVGYMCSHDGGTSWENAQGETIALPATAETIDHVAHAPEGPGVGLRAGSVAADRNGVPYVLYSDYDATPAEAFLAVPAAAGGWVKRRLRPAMPEALADYGLLTPGVVSIGKGGRIYLALTAAERREDATASLWGKPAHKVVWMELEEFHGAVTARVVSDRDDTTPAWLPNLERATGHNAVTRPGLIYTAGGPGEKNTDILSNDVYWVQP